MIKVFVVDRDRRFSSEFVVPLPSSANKSIPRHNQFLLTRRSSRLFFGARDKNAFNFSRKILSRPPHRIPQPCIADFLFGVHKFSINWLIIWDDASVSLFFAGPQLAVKQIEQTLHCYFNGITSILFGNRNGKKSDDAIRSEFKAFQKPSNPRRRVFPFQDTFISLFFFTLH